MPGEEARYVPLPCFTVTMFRETRRRMASRTELLPAPRREERTDSLGSRSPGFKFSSKIKEMMSSESFWERFFSSILSPLSCMSSLIKIVG